MLLNAVEGGLKPRSAPSVSLTWEDRGATLRKPRIDAVSKLSPAAHDALDAFPSRYMAAPCSGVAFSQDRHGIAAALHAAVKCLEELPESPDYSFWSGSHVHGIDRGVEKLLAIANELEDSN